MADEMLGAAKPKRMWGGPSKSALDLIAQVGVVAGQFPTLLYSTFLLESENHVFFRHLASWPTFGHAQTSEP